MIPKENNNGRAVVAVAVGLLFVVAFLVARSLSSLARPVIRIHIRL